MIIGDTYIVERDTTKFALHEVDMLPGKFITGPESFIPAGTPIIVTLIKHEYDWRLIVAVIPYNLKYRYLKFKISSNELGLDDFQNIKKMNYGKSIQNL